MCTGQTPNTALLREAFPESVIPDGPDRGMARVRRTLQIAKPVDEVSCPFWRLSLSAADAEALPFSPRSASPSSEDEQDDEPQIEIEEDPSTRVAAEHVFAIGDVADAFGAVNAGHNAFFQGEVAARNVLRLVRRGEDRAAEPEALEKYAPGGRAIKVSLGRVSLRGCVRGAMEADERRARAQAKCVYEFQGVIGTRDQEPEDLDVHLIWRYFGYEIEREDLENYVEPVVEEGKVVAA